MKSKETPREIIEKTFKKNIQPSTSIVKPGLLDS